MEKICGACRKSKPVDEFPPNKKNKDGLNTKCRLCYNEYMREWYKKNGDTHRARVNAYRPVVRARKYGLTVEEVKDLTDRHDGLCWICKERDAVNVDHDHTTGVVRGMLCFECNTGLGKLGDTVEGLERALDYLRAAVSPHSYKV